MNTSTHSWGLQDYFWSNRK